MATHSSFLAWRIPGTGEPGGLLSLGSHRVEYDWSDLAEVAAVPNPYILLSLLPPRTKVYTRLDLKDAFFCVRLTPASQPIFAFEWEDPVGGTKQQLIWTPPQGFKNSPAIFGEAVASDLNSFNLEEYGCWLLQYGDDLLLAAETKGKCWKGAKALLQLLMEAGY